MKLTLMKFLKKTPQQDFVSSRTYFGRVNIIARTLSRRFFLIY